MISVAAVRKILLARAGSRFSFFKVRGMKNPQLEEMMELHNMAAKIMRDK